MILKDFLQKKVSEGDVVKYHNKKYKAINGGCSSCKVKIFNKILTEEWEDFNDMELNELYVFNFDQIDSTRVLRNKRDILIICVLISHIRGKLLNYITHNHILKNKWDEIKNYFEKP